MTKALATRDKLLTEARRLLWARGYSNVSLREIAQGAGVDVALVSRYFGAKRGLFEATLQGAFEIPDAAGPEALVEMVVEMFVHAPRGGEMPSILQLIQTNASDAEVGQMVRETHARDMQGKLGQIIGDDARAALFMSILIGFGIGEKTLHLRGIPAPQAPEYAAQLRHMLQAALSYRSTAEVVESGDTTAT